MFDRGCKNDPMVVEITWVKRFAVRLEVVGRAANDASYMSHGNREQIGLWQWADANRYVQTFLD